MSAESHRELDLLRGPDELVGVYRVLWNEAFPYQDQRDDVGHISTVTNFAFMLLEDEPDADPAVVIPAIIFHDIGWSQLSEEDRMGSVNGLLTGDDQRRVRLAHQDEGVKLARIILDSVGYELLLIETICEIVSQHDTREGTFCIEDSVVRDADKLWRFSSEGVKADFRRRSVDKLEWLIKRAEEIEKPGYFFTENARNIARKELAERLKEYQLA